MNQDDLKEGDVNLTAARHHWQAQHLGKLTSDQLSEDADVFYHQSLSSPCLNVLQAAEGSWLTDLEGRKILDFHGNSLHQIGYKHPQVMERIRDCMDVLPFSPRRYANAMATALAKKLIQLSPIEKSRVLFSPNGATAVSMALKLAKWHTGRYKVISMNDSFHGATLDTISVGGEEIFHRGMGPLVPGCIHVNPYEPNRCQLGCAGTCRLACVDQIEHLLSKDPDIAAVLVETVRCTDVQIPHVDYYKKLRRACDRYGALLIVDEIPISLGRTGHWFAINAYGIEPDILVMGKGLGGGILPLAAMIGRSSFNTAGSVSLGHFTHEKNPVLCAAGLATIEVIEQEQLINRSQRLGARALSELRKLKSKHSCVQEVRGAGLLLAVELKSSMGQPAEVLAEEVLYACLEKGLSFKVGKGCVLVLSPPLNIEESDLIWALGVFDEALSSLQIKYQAV